MLLPPQPAERVADVESYTAQPRLQDELESRTDALVSERVDQTTYILQRAGKFSLPPIDIAWWNVRDGKIEHVTAGAVVFDIADNPAAQSPGENHDPLSRRQIAIFIADHRWTLMLILVVGSACAWFGRPAASQLRTGIRRQRDAYRRSAYRRSAYRRSEAFAFSKFRAAARQGDPGKTY